MRVLRTQLQEFVGAFISHDDGTRDSNVWIHVIKPARLSRSRGIVIADDLTSLLEACFGPPSVRNHRSVVLGSHGVLELTARGVLRTT